MAFIGGCIFGFLIGVSLCLALYSLLPDDDFDNGGD